MADNKTLGQIAYEAGARAGRWEHKWSHLSSRQKIEWEEVADTVAEHVLATRATPAPGAPAEPTEAMCVAMARRVLLNKPDGYAWEEVMRLAYLDAIAAAPGAPGQEAAAVQAVGMKAVGFVECEPRLGFAERKVGVLKEDISAGTVLYAALPPSGAGDKTS